MTFSLWHIRFYPAVIVLVSLVGSVVSPIASQAQTEPYTQEFLITAYYSPKPDQCCYIRGNYEAEIMFNGQGIRGASGIEVHPGMMAAPLAYAFGTRIAIPGIGVGTIEDRGGRIIEWENGLHRLDIWMGEGEEGLARALQWGARRVTATVYPLGTDMPAESLSLASFPAPRSALSAAKKVETTLLTAFSTFGDQTHAVRLLQQALRDLGYFDHALTNTFGPVTRDALARFRHDYGMEGDGSTADDVTRAMIIAAQVMADASVPQLSIVGAGSEGASVNQAQRVLRYIGAYDGRTDGVYDDAMREQVLAFQLAHGVISSINEAGAGRIGPKTSETILRTWRQKETRRLQDDVLRKMDLVRSLEKDLPARTLVRGDFGSDVRRIQQVLADVGFFPPDAINGNYGPLTVSALTDYQVSRSIIENHNAHGAGVFGPATRSVLFGEVVELSWLQIWQGTGTL